MPTNNEPDYSFWRRTRTPNTDMPDWRRDAIEREKRELRHQIIKQRPATGHPIGPNGSEGEHGFPLDPVAKYHLGLPTGTVPVPRDQPDWSLNYDDRFPARYPIHTIRARYNQHLSLPAVILDGVMTVVLKGRLPGGASIYQGDFTPPPAQPWEFYKEIDPEFFHHYMNDRPKLKAKLPLGSSRMKLNIPPELCVNPEDSCWQHPDSNPRPVVNFSPLPPDPKHRPPSEPAPPAEAAPASRENSGCSSFEADPVPNGDPKSAEGAPVTIAMGFNPWKADQPSEARPPQPPTSDNMHGTKKKRLPNSGPRPDPGTLGPDPQAHPSQVLSSSVLSVPLGSSPRENSGLSRSYPDAGSRTTEAGPPPLSEPQRKVIELIHQGYSVAGAMEYLRMSRRTFYDWREASPLFKEGTDASRENYRGLVADGVHELQQSTRALIETCIQSDRVPMGQRLRAASLFLRYVHSENLLPRPLAKPSPPSNPSSQDPSPSSRGGEAASKPRKSMAEIFREIVSRSTNSDSPTPDPAPSPRENSGLPRSEPDPEIFVPTPRENFGFSMSYPDAGSQTTEAGRSSREDIPSPVLSVPLGSSPREKFGFSMSEPDHGPRNPGPVAEGDSLPGPTPGCTSPVAEEPDILAQIPGLSHGHYLYDPSVFNFTSSDGNESESDSDSGSDSNSGSDTAHTEENEKPVRSVRSEGRPDPGPRHPDPATNSDLESAEGATQTIAMGFNPWKANQPSEARPPQPPAPDNAPGPKKKRLPNTNSKPAPVTNVANPQSQPSKIPGSSVLSVPLGSSPREKSRCSMSETGPGPSGDSISPSASLSSPRENSGRSRSKLKPDPGPRTTDPVAKGDSLPLGSSPREKSRRSVSKPDAGSRTTEAGPPPPREKSSCSDSKAEPGSRTTDPGPGAPSPKATPIPTTIHQR